MDQSCQRSGQHSDMNSAHIITALSGQRQKERRTTTHIYARTPPSSLVPDCSGAADGLITDLTNAALACDITLSLCHHPSGTGLPRPSFRFDLV